MQIIIFLFKIIKIHKIKTHYVQNCIRSCSLQQNKQKFQRLKIHTEMYSTNLIFDIVPEAEIGCIETIVSINYYETSYKLF